jgi:hypothetical protein
VKRIWTIAKYLGMFGAGAVAAGFFVLGPVDLAAKHSRATAVNGGWVLVPPTTPANWGEWTAARAMPEPHHNSPPLPSDQNSRETTGTSAVQRAADLPNVGQIEMTPRRDATCNVPVCRRYYRSFDEATCTYRPQSGGPPQLCNR